MIRLLMHLDPGDTVMRVILATLVQSSVVILLGALLARAAFSRRATYGTRSGSVSWFGFCSVRPRRPLRPFGACPLACTLTVARPKRQSGRRRDDFRHRRGREPRAGGKHRAGQFPAAFRKRKPRPHRCPG